MNINRREFLKLSTLLLLAGSPVHFRFPRIEKTDPTKPNILVIVFDAFSALNSSLFGYARNTTPFIEKLSEQAIVYHNHFASAPFTSPGTATLLTGKLPWTHRAFNKNGTVSKSIENQNIFNIFGQNGYYQVAYTHNYFADTLLRQFVSDISNYVPRKDLYISKYWISDLFGNDFDIAYLSALRGIETKYNGPSHSLYLSELYNWLFPYIEEVKLKPYRDTYTLGLPGASGQHFILDQAIDWVADKVDQFPVPFLGYFHFLPPHSPYLPPKPFIGIYDNDDYRAVEKPIHILSKNDSINSMTLNRRKYDQYINYVDFEFERLFNTLQEKGVLNNTWLVLTSDHGEMFERGNVGHMVDTLHQPVVKVPLLIFPPNQNEKVDIFETTSAIDLLPSLLQITGQSIPDWCEGIVMPPFGDVEGLTRPIIAMQAKENDPHNPITKATIMMIKNKYKMNFYTGYSNLPKGEDLIELYNLEEDPEELVNLYQRGDSLSNEFHQEITDMLSKVNKPYET
jgi:arylsulfatase A-like enzyme